MTQADYTRQALNYLQRKGVDLSADDYSWYGPFCQVVEAYTHGKLSIAMILDATDSLNDLLTDGLPGFHPMALPMSDRIQGQIRAMEFLPQTKGRLTYEEKEAFAFCVYYFTCVRIFDEKSGKGVMPIHEFESFEKIDQAYRSEKSSDSPRHALFAHVQAASSGKFGYDQGNPIRAVSIPVSYQYINRLRRVDGIPHSYNRLGSLPGPNGHIFDAYEFSYGNQKCILYVDAYSDTTSTVAPEGWTLGETQTTKKGFWSRLFS